MTMLSKDWTPDPARLDALLSELMSNINMMMLQSLGDKVLQGPFKGMTIAKHDECAWADGNFSTKLLGSYEFELHEALAFAVAREPKYIINLGCADGYYAVGMARLLPEVTVYAADIDERSVELTKHYAKINNVNVSTWVGCKTAADLRDDGPLLEGPTLYIVDVEGAELTLLDQKEVPELIHGDIIVECHEFQDPNIGLKLTQRFGQTHGIEIIKPRLPLFSRYEFLNKSPVVMQILAVTEKRPMPTLWLALWAHDRGD